MFVKVLYFYQICKRFRTDLSSRNSYHHFCFCFSQVKIRSSWPRLWFFSSSKALEGTAGYSTQGCEGFCLPKDSQAVELR